jgi:hypothetical protein
LKDPNDKEAETKEVEVDIRMKAYLNAKEYYQEKKRMETKEKKTMEASHQALKLAERAALAELNQVITLKYPIISIGKAEESYAGCQKNLLVREILLVRYLRKFFGHLWS